MPWLQRVEYLRWGAYRKNAQACGELFKILASPTSCPDSRSPKKRRKPHLTPRFRTQSGTWRRYCSGFYQLTRWRPRYREIYPFAPISHQRTAQSTLCFWRRKRAANPHARRTPRPRQPQLLLAHRNQPPASFGAGRTNSAPTTHHRFHPNALYRQRRKLAGLRSAGQRMYR